MASRSLIFVSLEVWDDIWRRNQFFAREWASRDWLVSFVGPARDLTYALRTGQFQRCLGGTATPRAYPQLQASRPLKFAPDSLAIGRRLNAFLLRQHLRSRIRGHWHLGAPILWVNDHNAYSAVRSLPRQCLVYDITDDWTTFQQNEAARKRIIDADRWLCQNADAVIVCSEKLFESKKSLVPPDRLFVVPNGVDIEHYRDCSQPNVDQQKSIANPVFGYTGSIHDQRLDVALVEGIAKRMTTGKLRFVGPDMLEPASRDRLLRTGKVEFCGPIPYEQLPQAMRAMDVMIVPHLVTPFTESLNPLKLWEYLASGKPIISTPVAGFRDYSKLIHLASSVEEFYQSMLQALAEPPDLRSRRQAAVAGHSWGARLEQIDRILEFASSNPRKRDSA